MKNINLVKQHPCVQLAHVYEHMFLREINRFLYEKGCFKTLDYFANGTTFDEGGIIVVECGFYTKKALAYKDNIANLSISMGVDNIHVSNALLEIAAEEPTKISVVDKYKIPEEIKLLNSQPWQPLDQIPPIDTKKIRRSSTPIYLTNIPACNPKTLDIKLHLNRDFIKYNRHLTPLANHLFNILLLSISTQITKDFPFYATYIYSNPKTFSNTSKLQILPKAANDIELQNIMDILQKTVTYMISSGFILRFEKYLQNISYNNCPYESPDIATVINESGFTMGRSAWRMVGTQDNILKILKEAKASLVLGRQKLTQNILPHNDC